MPRPTPTHPHTALLWAKRTLLGLGLVPAWRCGLQVWQGEAIDPVAAMTHTSGDWTLIFLLLTLSITPLRRLGLPGWLLRFRRMLGLFAFFYGLVHFSIYLALDAMFDLPTIGHDLFKRPFITVGFAALAMMTPLAITSTDGWIRRLKRHWGRLHRLVYAVAVLGVLHYWWLVKRDLRLPMLYAAILAILLGLRLVWLLMPGWRRGAR